MSKQERVVCTGAKVKFIKYFRGKPNNENITKEVIFPMISRNQEDHIVQVDTMLELSGGEDSDRFSKIYTQYGFITNKNRFVEPKEAMQIAIDAKQIIYLNSLYEQYTQDVIGNRGVSDRGRDLFNIFTHQSNVFKYQELKPEHIY